jgi:peptidoglycan hydrolase-like protein with peptidoglycan-binding domain
MLRSVKKGSKGPDVRAIQDGLNQNSKQDFQAGLMPKSKAPPVIGVDGDFGNETDGAVRDFQKRHGLDPDGIVGPKTRAALFPLAVETATVVGLRLRPGSLPTLQERVAAAFSPGALHLGGDSSDPAPAPTNPNLINLPGDLAKKFTPYRYEPYQFPSLFQPLAIPEIPEISIPTSSSIFGSGPNLGSWTYDHSELVPNVQTTFPFRGARQDAFTYTLQKIYTKGDPKGPHLEWTNGVQYGTPLTAVFSNGSIWTVTYFSQITDVDRFGALGNFHWWMPYAQGGGAFSTGSDLNPTITGSLVPFNLGYDATDWLTLTMSCGAVFGFNPFSGAGMLGGQCGAGANFKFGAPEPPKKSNDSSPEPQKRYW